MKTINMNTINYQLALKWILGLGIAWLTSLGFAGAIGFAGILFLGFAIAIAQRLALDLEQDWRYLGEVTACWAISYFIADLATKTSFAMSKELEIMLFGVLGGLTSSTMAALHLFKDGKKKRFWILGYALLGIVAGGISMGLYWFFTDRIIHSSDKQLWFLKVLAGIMVSGMVYGLITFIPVYFLPSMTAKQEST